MTDPRPSALGGVFASPAAATALEATLNGARTVAGTRADADWAMGSGYLDGSGALPPFELDGWFVVADGRLDNRPALGEWLGESPDADIRQLMLAAWLRDGVDGIDRLRGDFAIAMWHPGAGELVLATDPFRLRPLCVGHGENGELVVASTLPMVMASGLVPRRVEEVAAASVLMNLHAHRTRTLLRDVAFAESGAVSIHRPGSGRPVDVHRYWDAIRVPPNKTPANRVVAEYRRLLDAAVRTRIASDRPVASQVSGGLDSTTLGILARRMLKAQGRDCDWYSYAADAVGDIEIEDERPYVDAVCEQEGATTNYLFGLERSRFRELFEALGEAGTGVMLSGFGGDECATNNGRGIYAEWFKRGRWIKLARELWIVGNGRPYRMAAVFWNRVLEPWLPSWFWTRWRRWRGKPVKNALVDCLIREDAIQRLDLRGVLAREESHSRSDVRSHQEDLLNRGHFSLNYGNYYWSLGGSRGVEWRYPMLDRELVEFCLGLPGEWFRCRDIRRRLVREATADVLPDKVRWRRDKSPTSPDAPQRSLNQREQIAQRLDYLSKSEMLRSLVDFDRARAMQAALPEARDFGGNPGDARNLLQVGRVANLARALAMHELLDIDWPPPDRRPST